MLTLDLTNAPRWHDLAPGVRVQLRPLTTALMVATRSDPAVEAVPEEASDEERAVAFAKALARSALAGGLHPSGAAHGDADRRPHDHHRRHAGAARGHRHQAQDLRRQPVAAPHPHSSARNDPPSWRGEPWSA